jgi:hypothetical protein
MAFTNIKDLIRRKKLRKAEKTIKGSEKAKLKMSINRN